MKRFFTFSFRPYGLVALFLFCATVLSAQGIGVTINISNERKQAVAFSSIRIISRNDSTTRFNQVADTNGSTHFLLPDRGQYYIQITATGYEPFETGIRVPDQTVFTFTLLADKHTLGGVLVRSSRPLMRQEDDKTIVDPENLIPSSTSGYEVVEKTPGLFVDQDGNIYINSTTPATILVNGRELKMSTADIATMLKSLPPNAITSIEIVRTPSAKYDASGGGGIVNVVLKKGIKLGITGSATAGWQQGQHGNELAGFNLNSNNGRLSSFINMNYGHRDSYERIKTNRIIAPDTVLGQDAGTRYPSDNYFLGYGLNYEYGKVTLGYDGRVSLNVFNNQSSNSSLIRKISMGQTLTDNLASIGNTGNGLLITQGLSSKYRIDSVGSEWSTDLSYTYARNNTDQAYFTSFNIPAVSPLVGDGNSLDTRNFGTLQSDLTWKWRDHYTFESGLKTSLLSFRSITGYYTGSGTTREKDITRTNTFHYRENINAAYVQASKSIGDIVIKIGTRLENTNMNGRQLVPGDTTFAIHRTDLFPYVYLSKKVITIAGYDLRAYLVYRRTISRPVYEQLNPFPRYVDQYLSETGNPSLRPQFTQNYEANISVNETPLLAVGINRTSDIFTNVIYQSDSSHSQAYRTYDNLGRNREFYLRGLGAIPPGGRYFFVVGGQYNHNFYQGGYDNKPLSFKKGTWTFFTYHSLKLDKRSQLSMNGFIRLKGQQQFYELGPFGALNASINRQFFRQKLIVTFSANDIFETNRNDFLIRQGSVDASGYRESDTRRFGINLRYNFGIRKKEEAQNIFNMGPPEKLN